MKIRMVIKDSGDKPLILSVDQIESVVSTKSAMDATKSVVVMLSGRRYESTNTVDEIRGFLNQMN